MKPNWIKLNWTRLNWTERERANVSKDNVIFIGSAYRMRYTDTVRHYHHVHKTIVSWYREWRKKLPETSTKRKQKKRNSDCKTLQHWIIHQTDFLPRSVHSDCFISYSTHNKISHSLQIPIFISYMRSHSVSHIHARI